MPTAPPTDPASPRAGARLRRWAGWAVALAVVAVLVVGVLPRVISPAEALAVLRGLDRRLVALAALAQLGGFVGRGLVFSATARLLGARLPLGRAVQIALAAMSVNLIGGGAVGASAAVFRWTRHRGVPAEGAALVGLMPSLISIPTVGAAGLLGAAYLLAVDALRPELATGVLVAVGVLLGAAVAGGFVLARPARLAGVLRRASRLVARVRRRPLRTEGVDEAAARLTGAVRQLRAGGWRGPATGDAVRIGFDVLTLGLLFAAAGFTVWPAALLAGYGLPMLVSKLSPWPGAVGLVEGGMALVFTALGLDEEVAIVVIVAFRVLSFWLPFVLGIPAAAALERAAPAAGENMEGSGAALPS